MMSFSSFLVASLLGVAALGGRVEAEVLVGVADTFSGPGGWGVQIKRSIDLAADEVNAAGGLLGEPLRVTWSDDACDAEQALAAARKDGR
jgi:branched-chain amino acid transport system substrate-binding protein